VEVNDILLKVTIIHYFLLVCGCKTSHRPWIGYTLIRYLVPSVASNGLVCLHVVDMIVVFMLQRNLQVGYIGVVWFC
jgi:hypothetical protein